MGKVVPIIKKYDNWVMWAKRTNDPKLAALEKLLDDQKIPHRRNGRSFHAPICEVPEEFLDRANDILYRVDEIPDDDPMWGGAGDE